MVEGFPCGEDFGPDQISSLYIWNNSANPQNGYTVNGIDNACPASIELNRDYYLSTSTSFIIKSQKKAPIPGLFYFYLLILEFEIQITQQCPGNPCEKHES
jgi:hypothetical protein